MFYNFFILTFLYIVFPFLCPIIRCSSKTKHNNRSRTRESEVECQNIMHSIQYSIFFSLFFPLLLKDKRGTVVCSKAILRALGVAVNEAGSYCLAHDYNTFVSYVNSRTAYSYPCFFFKLNMSELCTIKILSEAAFFSSSVNLVFDNRKSLYFLLILVNSLGRGCSSGLYTK